MKTPSSLLSKNFRNLHPNVSSSARALPSTPRSAPSLRILHHRRDFLAALDTFLGALPKGWNYGVEIRNKTWLVPEYFAMLRSHGVAHVFNNWTRMPSIAEQLAIGGSSDTADFTVSRFLLKPGRPYEASVETFQPSTALKEPNEEARTAAQKILEQSIQKKRRASIYINNRLEGCAPLTIEGLLSRLTHPSGPAST